MLTQRRPAASICSTFGRLRLSRGAGGDELAAPAQTAAALASEGSASFWLIVSSVSAVIVRTRLNAAPTLGLDETSLVSFCLT